MLRLLTNIPLPIHLLLIVFIFVIRLPSLIGGFYLEEESLYFLCAQRIAEGGNLYTDAWLAGPPFMVTLYWMAYKLFGGATIIMMRIIACFYLYFSAIYFNGIIESYRLFKRTPYLSGFLFAFLVSIPWYVQSFNSSLFVLFPIIFSFHVIIRLNERRNRSYSLLFQVGVLMTICVLATYKTVFILLGIMIAYLIIVSPKVDELLAMMGGVAFVIAVMVVGMFFSGNLLDFWDVGCLFYLDRIRMDAEQLYTYEVIQAFSTWGLHWGIIILLSVFGFIHYRLRFFNYIVKIRSFEFTMRIWLFIMIITLVFKLRRLELQDFILLVPPIVFYAGKSMDFKWNSLMRLTAIVVGLGISSYSFSGYFGMAFPKTFEYFMPKESNQLLHGGLYAQFQQNNPVREFIKKEGITSGVWIMGDDPSVYLQMGLVCPNKYTDFRIAYNKMESFRDETDFRYYSEVESHAETFSQFYSQSPACIVDLEEKFSYLKKKYPGLFSDYKLVGENLWMYKNQALTNTE